MTDTRLQRINMVESQVRPSDVTDRRIIRAMLEVPRELFVAEALQALAYMDQSAPVAAGVDAGGATRALLAPRYESYAFPHFNLGRVYETRRRFLEAARHYGLALEQKPDFTEAAVALRRMQARLN